MHDWQHFWTRFQGHLWKLVHIFDITRGVGKLTWERIKRAEGENGCIGRDTNGKWRTQEIRIVSLRGWGPRRFTTELKNQDHSLVPKNTDCEVQACRAAGLCRCTAILLHSTQTSRRVLSHSKKYAFSKQKTSPLNSSQNALQPCLKKTGPQTERGNSPSRGGVRTNVGLKVGQDLELGTQTVTYKNKTTGE